ncbi:PREDICTED: uncharacterized protein LOC109582003 isoform X1 [Amphimedon queenslandica]|uniref:5MP1/2-like HEAT domain-containing protein n=1 Tax=Amphimedon queenslandica TaxID=400682 RepID=A0AAN0J5T7_AMPQE|nr:PREDICTED: uncharacterized protein LOC109582003 isoform X1 [Amphimedon queenslandica]|eukprot:XP_019852098.1 PREDICTED: uncharacterized protein LOC109582003 isoform X1 [Amphimedon queenslandica]
MCAAKEPLPTLAGYTTRERDKKDKYAYEEERGVRYETKMDEKAKNKFDAEVMEPLLPTLADISYFIWEPGPRRQIKSVRKHDSIEKALPSLTGASGCTKRDESAKLDAAEEGVNYNARKRELKIKGARYTVYKTRKRDEKVKYDAESFADTLISKLNETDGSPEALLSVLAKEGETLDYR